MSLLWADFPSGQTGLYGTTEARMLDGLYADQDGAFELIEDPDPNVTGNVCHYETGTTGSRLRKVLPAAVSALGIGERVWFPTLPPSVNQRGFIAKFKDNNNVTHVSFYVDTTGTISAYRGNYSGGTLLGTSTSPVIVAGAWQNVEMKVLFSNTVGTIEVRVEGVVVAGLNLTGLDTVNSALTTCAQIEFGFDDTANFAQWYQKDLVVWDTAGSINNDFFGSVSVYALRTDGDVSLNWTPSTGATGWNLLDESPPDDADYISAGDPPPSPAVMSLTDLPEDVTSVRGLIAIARSRKTDGGDGNLQVSMVSNGTPGNGSDRPITTAFTYWFDVFETDPDTSAAWTPVAVDAADIQFDRTL